MIVVDTNIIAYFYLESIHSKDTVDLLRHDPVWIVPFLWRSEFRSVLGLYLRKKILFAFPHNAFSLSSFLLQEEKTRNKKSDLE